MSQTSILITEGYSNISYHFSDDPMKKKLFNDLKQVLKSLPVKLPESDVIELVRAAWKVAVIEDVHDL